MRNDKNHRQQQQHFHHSIFVTGFGPFGSIEVNPTTVLCQKLAEQQERHRGTQEYRDESLSSNDGSSQHQQQVRKCTRVIRCVVLETSAGAVTEFFQTDATNPYQLVTTSNYEDENHHCFCRIGLHFGVNETARKFHVERIGYNCADFRIPDQRVSKSTRK